ncbi:DMT family transporter [Phenylobacterium sp. J426]|uniref:DMT family transporter n=1 Tax=Phenylobacterium sp. J426 TaxID=2898439 RepID=UPI002151E523|nr:DMT family transporter [Phenylobacterium sp. J426]MCR5874187.1 DMT family transporter [Phenylobacterium sp. J426]
MSTSRASDWLVLAFLVICWGSAFAALRVSTEHVGPFWNTAGRLMVAAPVLALVVAGRRERPPPGHDRAWLIYAAIGFVGLAAPFALFAFSAQRLPSAVNAICNGASPIFTAVLAHLFVSGERLSARKGLGVLVGFAGLATLVAPRLQAADAVVEAEALGAALLGALLYAVANVLTKRAPPLSSSVGALMMCLTAGAFGIAAALALEPLPPLPPAPALLSLVALGVFPTGLASVGFVYLVRRRGPVFMSMAVYLAPLWATALGVAILGERPGWPAFAALGLILAGVALTTYAPAAKRD